MSVYSPFSGFTLNKKLHQLYSHESGSLSQYFHFEIKVLNAEKPTRVKIISALSRLNHSDFVILLFMVLMTNKLLL